MNPQDPNTYPPTPVGPTPPQPSTPPVAPVQPPQPPVAEAAPVVQPAAPVAEPMPVVSAPVTPPQEPATMAAPEASPMVDPAATMPALAPVPVPTPAVDPIVTPVAPQPPVAGPDSVIPAAPPIAGPVGTAPQAFGTGPAAEPPKKPKLDKKRVTLIGLIVGGAVLIGVGLWLIFGVLLATVPLEKYEGKTYSVMVPKEYTRDEVGTMISFDEPDENSDTRSRIMISSYDITSALEYTTKDKLVELYDETLSEKSITGSNVSGNNKIVNFKKETIKYQNHDARMITFEATENDKKVGQGQALVVFTDKAIYTVIIIVHIDDTSLARTSDKIIHSLKINE